MLSARASFVLLASTTVAFMAGSSAPTPLYPIYQAAWGFSPITTTGIFATSALAVLGSPLVFGKLTRLMLPSRRCGTSSSDPC